MTTIRTPALHACIDKDLVCHELVLDRGHDHRHDAERLELRRQEHVGEHEAGLGQERTRGEGQEDEGGADRVDVQVQARVDAPAHGREGDVVRLDEAARDPGHRHVHEAARRRLPRGPGHEHERGGNREEDHGAVQVGERQHPRDDVDDRARGVEPGGAGEQGQRRDGQGELQQVLGGDRAPDHDHAHDLGLGQQDQGALGRVAGLEGDGAHGRGQRRLHDLQLVRDHDLLRDPQRGREGDADGDDARVREDALDLLQGRVHAHGHHLDDGRVHIHEVEDPAERQHGQVLVPHHLRQRLRAVVRVPDFHHADGRDHVRDGEDGHGDGHVRVHAHAQGGGQGRGLARDRVDAHAREPARDRDAVRVPGHVSARENVDGRPHDPVRPVAVLDGLGLVRVRAHVHDHARGDVLVRGRVLHHLHRHLPAHDELLVLARLLVLHRDPDPGVGHVHVHDHAPARRPVHAVVQVAVAHPERRHHLDRGRVRGHDLQAAELLVARPVVEPGVDHVLGDGRDLEPLHGRHDDGDLDLVLVPEPLDVDERVHEPVDQQVELRAHEQDLVPLLDRLPEHRLEPAHVPQRVQVLALLHVRHLVLVHGGELGHVEGREEVHDPAHDQLHVQDLADGPLRAHGQIRVRVHLHVRFRPVVRARGHDRAHAHLRPPRLGGDPELDHLLVLHHVGALAPDPVHVHILVPALDHLLGRQLDGGRAHHHLQVRLHPQPRDVERRQDHAPLHVPVCVHAQVGVRVVEHVHHRVRVDGIRLRAQPLAQGRVHLLHVVDAPVQHQVDELGDVPAHVSDRERQPLLLHLHLQVHDRDQGRGQLHDLGHVLGLVDAHERVVGQALVGEPGQERVQVHAAAHADGRVDDRGHGRDFARVRLQRRGHRHLRLVLMNLPMESRMLFSVVVVSYSCVSLNSDIDIDSHDGPKTGSCSVIMDTTASPSLLMRLSMSLSMLVYANVPLFMQTIRLTPIFDSKPVTTYEILREAGTESTPMSLCEQTRQHTTENMNMSPHIRPSLGLPLSVTMYALLQW
ncbi:hypothetical protein B0J12DRAFT_106241 [Macrophomina phaseolina]|uniref:Uncharacterized protein n=1 Tax=Macrophomina phaseolina TaxID=35725 RepID=A0ABQ8FPB8_9PEZI|nr:hypothetical protein B0J12DRAFT_106241 [Macrophomina phaseolina]